MGLLSHYKHQISDNRDRPTFLHLTEKPNSYSMNYINNNQKFIKCIAKINLKLLSLLLILVISGKQSKKKSGE